MRMALFISLPIACTLFVLRAPVVAVFLHHGAFSDTAVRTVSLLFGFFLIGMPAGIMSFYLAKVFYALEETWSPTPATILSLIFAAVAMPLAANHFGLRQRCSSNVCGHFLAWRSGTDARVALEIRRVQEPARSWSSL